jgi:ABC-type oligopeptide transport system substrate-binding subunit
MFQSGWCADYPDPENFADALFHTGATQNASHYSNPQVDTLLENARVEKDVSKRIEMYQQAEQMIVNDAPAVFLTHPIGHELVKPYVKGYVFSPIGIPDERYLSLKR